MGAHDGGVEHLDQMRRRTHAGKRIEEGLEDARLAEPVEALPYLFQFPNRSGNARQRTFSTVKKCSASRNSLSSAAFRPRRGRQALNTVSAAAQSSSLVRAGIASDLQISRKPMNHK